MNYQHIYHAGNFADVFKHIILCLCLEKLQEKDKPFFVLDTHAGCGKYDLFDEKSQKTKEAESGIFKLINHINNEIFPTSYFKILAKINCCELSDLPNKLRFYAGSPILIKNFLRNNDKAIFAEINHDAFLQLKRNFAGNKKITTVKEDGFHLIKSKLPPLERRGLILIDAAFEKGHNKVSTDYQSIVNSLIDAKKRFANGIYLIWYPIIQGEEDLLKEFYFKINQINFLEITNFEFHISDNSFSKMNACGMFIINTPWQVDTKINLIINSLKNII